MIDGYADKMLRGDPACSCRRKLHTAPPPCPSCRGWRVAWKGAGADASDRAVGLYACRTCGHTFAVPRG